MADPVTSGSASNPIQSSSVLVAVAVRLWLGYAAAKDSPAESATISMQVIVRECPDL